MSGSLWCLWINKKLNKDVLLAQLSVAYLCGCRGAAWIIIFLWIDDTMCLAACFAPADHKDSQRSTRLRVLPEFFGCTLRSRISILSFVLDSYRERSQPFLRTSVADVDVLRDNLASDHVKKKNKKKKRCLRLACDPCEPSWLKKRFSQRKLLWSRFPSPSPSRLFLHASRTQAIVYRGFVDSSPT